MTDERLYLRHIRDAISDITQYASGDEGAFFADSMRQDAIIRKLEIIGEAVKRPSEATRAQRPAVPWKQLAGMPDRLTHAYFGVDLGPVWRVVERDLQRSRRPPLTSSRRLTFSKWPPGSASPLSPLWRRQAHA